MALALPHSCRGFSRTFLFGGLEEDNFRFSRAVKARVLVFPTVLLPVVDRTRRLVFTRLLPAYVRFLSLSEIVGVSE